MSAHGQPDEQARMACVAQLLGYLVGPQPKQEVAEVALQNGQRQPVLRQDMVSPALLEEAVSAGIDAALRKSLQQGRLVGLDADDVVQFLHRHFAELVPTLHPHNIAEYCPRLFQKQSPLVRDVQPAAGTRSTSVFAPVRPTLPVRRYRPMHWFSPTQTSAAPDAGPANGNRDDCHSASRAADPSQRAGQQRHPSRPFPGRRHDRARSARVLAPMINIDPAAVAVINGQIVDEDTVLGGDLGHAELRETEFAQGLARWLRRIPAAVVGR